jgi:hypothetical protein
MSSLAEMRRPNRAWTNRNPRGDGDKKEFVAGERTKETVKTIARGKPGDFRRTRGDYRVLTTNAHGLRVHRASGFPCALCLQRDKVLANLGLIASREGGLVSYFRIDGRGTPGNLGKLARLP